MASKKKKLTPLQKEYNKQYRAYIKRIESARQAGFLIPEEHVKVKKEKPRRRDIESLKKVTRKSIQAEVKKGKLEYVSPFTGEVITGGRAVDISRKRRPVIKETPELISEHKSAQQRLNDWLFSEANSTRPTTFDEAQQVIERIRYYFDRYEVPESAKEWQMERIMEQTLRTLRGPTFNFDTFKETEIKHGWLFRDPNRPLEQEEINYIQAKIDADLEAGKEPIVGEYVDELRGWKPEYNYFDKYYENEKKSGNIPSELFDLKPENIIQDYGLVWDRGERPETIERPESNIGEIPIETVALDNLRERIRNIELSGESYKSRVHTQSIRDRIFKTMADNNKNILEERLDALIKKYGASYVDAAIARANATGRAFQEYFLYRGTIMSQYLTDIEQILLGRNEYYQIAEQVESGGDSYNEPR